MGPAVPLPEKLLKAVQRALPRWNRRRCATLAGELSTLWWGLRTAVLLDTCSLEEDEAAALGTALQAVQKNVFVAYEPVSGQTLALDNPPTSFHALLTSLSAHSPSSPSPCLTLPSPDHPTNLIPLVGFLLDYPVAYYLSHERGGRNCLGGEELVVTEAELVEPGETRQRLLAFSYPARLAKSISSEATAKALEDKLRARLASGITIHPELRGCRIDVAQRNVTLDQVAL
ncbi:hypothetical protein AAT19DRAFT_12331 [Rhodotorula toruloides]|uniref:Uncharacterized protein n=1 Tax=Rhodotorula toruloides TaxID=5286 RepID=A0A2T0AFY2_RHOTO|nr:hypothetical protein AAT19DRAFT_12331 [Rhodotorula toruloides]